MTFIDLRKMSMCSKIALLIDRDLFFPFDSNVLFSLFTDNVYADISKTVCHFITLAMVYGHVSILCLLNLYIG